MPDLNDIGTIYDDQELERELRQALRSEGEIELFKVIREGMAVGDELINNPVIQAIVTDMWRVVAEFFDEIVNADTLQGMTHECKLVVMHKDMQSNFRAVAAINAKLKAAKVAEEHLVSEDQMNLDQGELEP